MQHEFSMPRVKKASSKYKEFIMPRKKSYAMRSAKPALLRQGCSASFLIEGHAGEAALSGTVESAAAIPSLSNATCTKVQFLSPGANDRMGFMGFMGFETG
jgi:hypothetical protein